MAQVEIVDHPEYGVFEARVDGEHAGGAYYRLDQGRVVFTHTEVDPKFQGQGVGAALAARALDAVRDSGRRAVPLCPFIAAYIDHHAEYANLVDGAG